MIHHCSGINTIDNTVPSHCLASQNRNIINQKEVKEHGKPLFKLWRQSVKMFAIMSHSTMSMY